MSTVSSFKSDPSTVPYIQVVCDFHYGGYQNPKFLMDIVSWWFPRERGISSLTDFGCGTGGYVKMLSYAGLYARGFDGNPKTGQLDVSGGLCKGPVDLRSTS